MIKGRDIIVHGLQSLDSPIGSNCVNIAHEFSKHNRVLYVNFPMDRLTLARRRNDEIVKERRKVLNAKKDDLVQLSENLWNLNPKTVLESISQLKSRKLFNILNKVNSKRYAKQVQMAIDKLGFKDFIIFNDSDFYRAQLFKDILKPKTQVYYTRDNMRATNFFKHHGSFYEDNLMKKSDLVLANSVYLQKIALRMNPNSFYVGQGCDISHFSNDIQHDIPADLASIPKPIIGYIGALKSSRLDIETLEDIANKKPNWNIVLVGPEDQKFVDSNLHNLKNVYFLGSKAMSELPAYLKFFDVAINPQALNPLTIGNYPRKIDEYLAMGKPTVATQTETMAVFSEHVYLSNSSDEYISNIEKAITENTEANISDRIRFAKEHTWENNVQEIYKAINLVETKNEKA